MTSELVRASARDPGAENGRGGQFDGCRAAGRQGGALAVAALAAARLATRRAALSALLAAMLFLTACGGGGGDSPTRAAPTPDPEPEAAAEEPELPFMLPVRFALALATGTATADDVRSVAFGPAIESAAKAAPQAPVSGMAAQSRSSGEYTARVAFDDGALSVSTCCDQGLKVLSFDEERPTTTRFNILAALGKDGIFEDRTRHEYSIFDRGGFEYPIVPGEGATAGRVVVDTADNNAGDWMALGYWWQLRGRAFDIVGTVNGTPSDIPILEAVEIGAFGDGPEFRYSPANLPVTRSATYRGTAVGAYMAEYGTDQPVLSEIRTDRGTTIAGSTFAGEFKAPMSLSMDFATRDVRGRLSESDGIFVSGVFTGGPSTGSIGDGVPGPGETRILVDNRIGLKMEFASAFNPNNGRFASDGVRLMDKTADSTDTPISVRQLRRIVKQEGQWSGQVSSILTAVGEPRAGIGTFGVDATTAGDTRHVFVGAFGVYHMD